MPKCLLALHWSTASVNLCDSRITQMFYFFFAHARILASIPKHLSKIDSAKKTISAQVIIDAYSVTNYFHVQGTSFNVEHAALTLLVSCRLNHTTPKLGTPVEEYYYRWVLRAECPSHSQSSSELHLQKLTFALDFFLTSRTGWGVDRTSVSPDSVPFKQGILYFRCTRT